MRTLLLVVLTVGLLGAATDLLLIGHYEEAWQMAPLILIGVALVLVLVLAVRATRWAVAALQVTMLLFVAAGIIGISLHYAGNREFQHEIDPTLSGWALFTTVMTAKAPPAMAPGAMVQLGLLGLVFTYRHPSLSLSEDRS
jgi:hypothetical protein